ncbi:MAG: FAD-dependent oxidoreductase [bacterium]|nr:FAD-dependent oxidoreductase [bacterium]
MKKADIVVVGGSAAGLTAAMTARRHYPEKATLLVRRERQVLIPCGIPYIFGTVGSAEKNMMPDSILDREGIELLIAEVGGIEREGGLLRTDAGDVGYDRLIIATGSLPSMPPIPGAETGPVFPILKDAAHLQDIQRRLRGARDVVVIGGGFIGIECADEIRKTGDTRITVVEIEPRCLSASYDDEFCAEAEAVLRSRGILIRTSTRVRRIDGGERPASVILSDGTTLRADVIIVGTGSVANVRLAREAGLRIGAGGAIEVDRTMRTSDPRIFACGDCAEKVSFFGGRRSDLKLASIATLEGRIAGANLYDVTRENPGTVGVWSTALGDFALGTAGLTESMAVEWGYEPVAATVEGANRHPAGMPGGAMTRMKLVFGAGSGVLLGGQVRGNDAAGEMINAIAACVQKRMTVEDIATFQMGTHPALTASPVAYPLVQAAELAIATMRRAAARRPGGRR